MKSHIAQFATSVLIGIVAATPLTSCTKKSDKPEFWIYTSMPKLVVADLNSKLTAQFPQADFKFFQAASEEVASKVGAEELAGGTRADLLIFADRFWFEEMAQFGRLHRYRPPAAVTVPDSFRNPDGFYTAVSLPVMVLVYNSDSVSAADAPKSFKEMSDPKWKDKFTTGSPLASGTNFTTVAFLQKAYGWNWFKALRANETISEGGSSSVIRRVQTKERPVGWVLLEAALPTQFKDPRIKIVYPSDGAIVQSNILALIKKQTSRDLAEKVADWFFGPDGQSAMVKGEMYPAVPGIAGPKGSAPFSEIAAKAPKWDQATVIEFMKARESIKEQFTDIMLQ